MSTPTTTTSSAQCRVPAHTPCPWCMDTDVTTPLTRQEWSCICMHAMRAPLSSPWQVGRQGPRAALNSPAGQKEAPGHRFCTMHGGEQEKTQVSSVLVRPIGFSRPGFGAEIKREKNIRFASNNNALVRASCTKGPPDRRIFGLTHPTAGEYLTRFCFRPSTKLKLRCHARRINGGALVC